MKITKVDIERFSVPLRAPRPPAYPPSSVGATLAVARRSPSPRPRPSSLSSFVSPVSFAKIEAQCNEGDASAACGR